MVSVTQPLVLVACPTAYAKDYSLDEYLASYEAYEWENKELFMVDTTMPPQHEHSRGQHVDYLAVLLGKGVNAMHIEPRGARITAVEAVSQAWPHILRFARKIEANYIFSNEVDIICPPETIGVLVDMAERYGAVHIAHTYPVRTKSGGRGHVSGGIGMSLFRSDLFTEKEIADGKGKNFKQFEYYAYSKVGDRNLPMIKLQDVIPGVKHLESPSAGPDTHGAKERAAKIL